MFKLSKLTPQPLWNIFYNICSIPHPSYHEELLAVYIIKFAKKKKLFVERDQIGNILIRKPATKKYKNFFSIAIQAHLDMVAQKKNDKIHNFLKNPIQPKIDGKWIKAHDTTLGADNGIGIASALSLLSDNNIEHGPLEILLTITEEDGMKGALNLQPNWIISKILINTDSEREDEIYIGCANGTSLVIQLPLNYETIPINYHILRIDLTGLKGGHSGLDIHLKLGNANKILNQFLVKYCKDLNIQLINLQGGSLINAIPRESYAILALPKKNIEKLNIKIQIYSIIVKNKFKIIDNKPIFNISKIEIKNNNLQILTKSCSDKFIFLLNSIPDGIIKMSKNIKDTIETSLNIGIVSINNKKANIHCLIRSIIDIDDIQIKNTLYSIAKLVGATITIKSSYPSWKPKKNSPITYLTCNIYEKIFKKKPTIKIVHAGLECGLFTIPYPDIDMISIGPTIIGAHSPFEKVNINSVKKYWKLLTSLLKEIPYKFI